MYTFTFLNYVFYKQMLNFSNQNNDFYNSLFENIYSYVYF